MPDVPFIDARPGDSALTYKPDPSGEHGCVTDREWFEDADEPVTVVEQRWRLIDQRTFTWHPPTTLCPDCGGEGCYRCDDGVAPWAGQWVEES